MSTIDERQNGVNLSTTPSARSNSIATYANDASEAKMKTISEVQSPDSTLRKTSETTIVVTDTNGKKHKIKFVLGVPARVSGIGSLSKSYSKPFSTSQIQLLQEAAYEQQAEQRDQAFAEKYYSWVNNSASQPVPDSATGGTSLVHYRKSLTESQAYVSSRAAQDDTYGRFEADTEELESMDGTTYSNVMMGFSDGVYQVAPNLTRNARSGSGSIVRVQNDVTPHADSVLNQEPDKLTYSDYAELYARGKGGNREKIHQAIGLIDMSQQEYLNYSTKYYNRFKMAVLDAQLQRSFAHVFFVKPSCNIKIEDGVVSTEDNMRLDQVFGYAWNHSPNVVRELAGNMTNSGTDFSFLLSNAAASFSLTDEYIDYESYGKGYTGYKISFGRHDAESKTAGDFTVTFQDDNNFNIYRLVKLWVDYISGTYRGMYAPKDSTIKDNIIDYAGACYYILTAEDGETILFWSKYYGVFPTTVPSTQYSWARGSLLSLPEIDVKFAYSFKEDYKISTIVEFNRNADVQSVDSDTLYYEKTFDPELGSVGKTWVGAPFIESEVKNGVQTFKLRFKQPESD